MGVGIWDYDLLWTIKMGFIVGMFSIGVVWLCILLARLLEPWL